MIFLQYIAAALVLLAVYYISKPKLRGQYLILCADTRWFVYGVTTRQWALVAQSAVLFAIGVSAVINWKARGIEL